VYTVASWGRPVYFLAISRDYDKITLSDLA
jgi:hypothetical protein